MLQVVHQLPILGLQLGNHALFLEQVSVMHCGRVPQREHLLAVLALEVLEVVRLG